jgi:hypothetical protein
MIRAGTSGRKRTPSLRSGSRRTAAIEEVFENYAAERYETRITGDGVLVTRGEIHVRSRGTNIELSTPTFWGGEFRDGLVLVSEIFDGPPSRWDEANAIT